MGLNRWLGCIENPRTGREAVAAARAAADARRDVRRRRRRAGRAAGRHRPRPSAATRSSSSSATPSPAARPAWPPRCPAGPSSATSSATWCTSASGSASRSATGVEADVATVLGGAARRGGRRHRRRAGPAVLGAAATRPTIVDVRDVLEGGAAPAGRVVVVDELGFHQATSVAELLADRGCWVTVVTPGMVVARTSASPSTSSTGTVRAAAKGIGQTHRPGADGLVGRAASRCRCCTTPPAPDTELACDWVVLAVPPQPVDGLYQALLGAPGSRCTASATASPPAGPTPRWSRATASGRRCDRPTSRPATSDGRCRRRASGRGPSGGPRRSGP